MQPDRQLEVEGLHNIRDLGGVPLISGGETRRGAIYRGCALRELTPRGRRGLTDRGIATVIDLRSHSERAAHPTWLAAVPEVKDIHVPLFADLAPVYKAAQSSRGFSLSERYVEALRKAAPLFAQAVTSVAEAPEGPVLIHCTAGKDRTGLLSALLLSLAGAEPAGIISDYHMSVIEGRPYMERLRRSSRARKTAPRLLEQMLDAPPAAMAEALACLSDDYGGARAYLLAAGASEAALAAAAGRLRG